jgi:hypothetical protein
VEGVVRSAAGRRGAPASLIAFAAVALALGVLVYLTDRPPGTAALLPWAGTRSATPLLGTIGRWLPSFAHVFAFALLTAATARPSTAPPYWACALWWAVDVVFEVVQAAPWKASVADVMRRCCGDGWLPSLFARYAELGTFDPGDLVAITVGALAAAALLARLWCPGDPHDL